LRCGHIASIKVRVISAIMGRTIPSFRTVLDMEKEEWKPFRNALANQIERSLMKCGIFLGVIFQLALILYNM
jgi:hypothetical protein